MDVQIRECHRKNLCIVDEDFHPDVRGYRELVRCKDCKYAHLTYDGDCKYCDNFTDDDGFPIERYHPGDWFCADGEKRID